MKFTERQKAKLVEWADSGVENTMDGSVGGREASMRLIEIVRVLGKAEHGPASLTPEESRFLVSLFRPPHRVAAYDVADLIKWSRLLGRVEADPNNLSAADFDLLTVFSENEADLDDDAPAWVVSLHERIEKAGRG